MDFSVFDFEKKELLLTAGVLLTIFAVSFFQLKIGQMKTRDVQRKSDVGLVARAIDAYYKDYQTLPLGSPDGEIISCGRKALSSCVWGKDDFIDPDNVAYLKHLPTDPQSYKGLKYVYVPDLKTNKYKIYVALEYLADSEIKKNLTVACGNNVQCNWYAAN